MSDQDNKVISDDGSQTTIESTMIQDISNISNSEEEFIIYKINGTYKIKKNDDNSFKCKQKAGTIQEIIKLLEKIMVII